MYNYQNQSFILFIFYSIYLQEAQNSGFYLDICNLPLFVSNFQVRQRIEQIAENCGGKMVQLIGSRGIIRFNTHDLAQR